MAYYPPPAFHFSVDFSAISGIDNDARFQSVNGLNAEMTTEEYKEGGENRFVHVLPLKAKYPKLTLKRGLLLDSDVQKWCMNTIESLKIEPIDLVVKLLNEEHEPLRSWNIVHAWPTKWEVSELNAENNSIMVETIELTYHYYTVE